MALFFKYFFCLHCCSQATVAPRGLRFTTTTVIRTIDVANYEANKSYQLLHIKIIHHLSNTAIDTTENRCLERDSNSRLQVSRNLETVKWSGVIRSSDYCHGWLGVFQIYYIIILRDISKIFTTCLTPIERLLPWMTCSVSILLQNHPQRHIKIIHNLSNTAIETAKNRCLERQSNSNLWSSRNVFWDPSFNQ